MDYIIIEVPDMNDSMSRVVLNGTAYLIRFTWNDTGAYWKFGLYDSQNQPIVIGIKLVANFPLNVFYGVTQLPDGVFGVMTRQERIGRQISPTGRPSLSSAPLKWRIDVLL